jgi:hypothetical protein
MARKRSAVTVGSGNVFRDLGLKNPEELLAKAKLAARLMRCLTALHRDIRIVVGDKPRRGRQIRSDGTRRRLSKLENRR